MVMVCHLFDHKTHLEQNISMHLIMHKIRFLPFWKRQLILNHELPRLSPVSMVWRKFEKPYPYYQKICFFASTTPWIYKTSYQKNLHWRFCLKFCLILPFCFEFLKWFVSCNWKPGLDFIKVEFAKYLKIFQTCFSRDLKYLSRHSFLSFTWHL